MAMLILRTVPPKRRRLLSTHVISIRQTVRILLRVTRYETPSCNIYSPFPASQHILPIEIEIVDLIAK